MSLQKLLEGLDSDQRKAVTLQTNAVVAAGAGSGKTKVLASRYVWLVIEHDLKPEEILTLTFTNKAVSEMYSRIYNYLLDQANSQLNDGENATGEKAENAIRNFHKAKIRTLDSFSAAIAKTAAARYGISPDFSTDDAALRDLAREAALRFVLDNRESPAIRQLLVDHRIRKLSDAIFASVMLEHSPISNPPDYKLMLKTQKEKILKIWQEKSGQLLQFTNSISDSLRECKAIKKSIKLTTHLEKYLLEQSPPVLPDITLLFETSEEKAGFDLNGKNPFSQIRQQMKAYFDFYGEIISERTPSNYGNEYQEIVNLFGQIKGKNKDGLYYSLESVANYVLNFNLSSNLFSLIEKFQNEFNAKKRETSLLRFNDVAHLAVDALKNHADIRKIHKDTLRMIMIDEFQDNNALQRDLIYLLAENTDRTEKGIPKPQELENNRMFFVGDEKQSIYRFRGADVAVFRSLNKDMGNIPGSGGLELSCNYRSQPALIAAFNYIFQKVFFPVRDDVPDYEASYSSVHAPESAPSFEKPLAHFCFLNAEEIPEQTESGIKSQDLEAIFIAGKIQEMVLGKEKIPKRNGQETVWEDCTWNDFAVLQRSYAHQGTLEKYFREFGIPYNTDRPSGLFNDAPILDLCAYIRLLVYPEDRIAYAALIRSPFMRLSDLTLAVCLLSENPAPFAEENEIYIPESDLALYRDARKRYNQLREESRVLSATELVTKLWFEEGYRYETIWTESAQAYESLFDLFFSLASESDERGKSLAEFIEYIDDIMTHEEKPDVKDLPSEGQSGVKILSIHKSKGLEFPVVFIYNCAQQGNIRDSNELINFHEKYGVILKIPRAEELPVGGNYFRQILLEEKIAKDTAELRRLLYVAMTRAEYRVFLTFTLPKQNKDEKKDNDLSGKEFSEEVIRERLAQLAEKTEAKRKTFLSLLSEVLSESPENICDIQIIPASQNRIKKQPLPKSQKETALAATLYYENAELLPEGKAGISNLDASRLQNKMQITDAVIIETETPFDILVRKAKINAAEAGTLVHAVLEAHINNAPTFIPAKIRARIDNEKVMQDLLTHAKKMTDTFFASQLGKRVTSATYKKPEFHCYTKVNVEGKPIILTGKMDLLFEEPDEVVVVDFKTDRVEKPEDHLNQLATYYQAAFDIFGKRVSVWLFYLRSASAVNVTENVRQISLEDLAAQALQEKNLTDTL